MKTFNLELTVDGTKRSATGAFDGSPESTRKIMLTVFDLLLTTLPVHPEDIVDAATEVANEVLNDQ